MSQTHRRVGELMHDDVVIVHRDHSLTEARDRLRAASAPGAAVVDGDRVIAVVGLSDIVRLMAQLGEEAHLRDGVAAGLRFCNANDELEVAAATLAADDAELLAVVDDERRIVGLLTRQALGRVGAQGLPRPVVQADDRSGEAHPGLEVYAPWAVVEQRV